MPLQTPKTGNSVTWHRKFGLVLFVLAAIGLAVCSWMRSGDYRPHITMPPARHLGECGEITFYWQSWLPPAHDSLAWSPPAGLALGHPRRRPVSWRLWRVSVPFWAEALTTNETTLYCQQVPVANLPAMAMRPRPDLPFPRLTSAPQNSPVLPTWEIFLLAIAWLCVLADCGRLLAGKFQSAARPARPDHTLESLLPPPGPETPSVAEARRFAKRLLFDRDARTPDTLACALSLRQAAIRSRIGRPRP
jgi:hypothetical protein